MRTICYAALAAILLPGFAAAQNLLDDGDLDVATSGSTTSNSDWTLTINMPDGTDRSAQFQTGFANANNTGVGGTQPPGTGTGLWFRSFEGDQGNSGQPLAEATLSQTIVAPLSKDYRLTFVAGREVDHISQTLEVVLSSDGTGGSATADLLSAVIPDGNLGGGASLNPGGTLFSLKLLGVTAGDNLTVTARMLGGEDNVGGGGQSAFLDEFSLTAVPEPGSLLLASLAVAGVAVWRRRRCC